MNSPASAAPANTLALTPASSRWTLHDPPHRPPPVSLRPIAAGLPCWVSGSIVLGPNNTLYLYGGYDVDNTENVSSQLHSLNLDDLQWTRVPLTKSKHPVYKANPDTQIASERLGHAAVLWQQRYLLIFGGEDAGSAIYNEITIIDLQLHTFENPITTGDIPSHRTRSTAVLIQDTMYITGGQYPDARNPTCQGDIYSLDLYNMNWKKVREYFPRYDQFSFLHGDCIYSFAGLTPDITRTDELTCYNLNARQSNRIRTAGPSCPRQAVGNHLHYYCEGYLIDVTTQGPASRPGDLCISSYSIETGEWKRIADGTLLGNGYTWVYMVGDGSTRVHLVGSGPQDNTHLAALLTIELSEFGIEPKSSLTNNAVTTFGREIGSLLDISDTCDFTITTSSDIPGDDSENILRAHSLILHARWPHFRSLIDSQMTESVERVLHLPEQYSVIKAFLTYLYTDSIPRDTPVNLLARLLVLANLYAMTRLRSVCMNRLLHGIDIVHAAVIWDAAMTTGEEVLHKKVVSFSQENWGKVVRTSGFYELGRESLVAFCIEAAEDARIVDEIECDNVKGDKKVLSQDSSSSVSEDDDD
ncbi:RCC1 and BTB domain-containing protein 1 [Neolecta irregularis DAH-3]|uniref:RCC1 and BTB domain-containing protein 1 n=1 Tax=Neolecta irregularis (strain DAH-3) TaxID=1198029 RepID=A0A1U7LKG4_NEOID|nr:RCC1 and BTB domain-containing protein 1 [Neolecta irregularis DAH-3]|eukprot:OLL23128.1 RCC1 and BTB domain-containing protein 1 [Neolecta irregularis DAH-3]